MWELCVESHEFTEDDNLVHQKKHSNIGVLRPLFLSGVFYYGIKAH